MPRQRLGRPGRLSQVYDPSSFFRFLEDLPNRGQLQDGSNRASLRRIHNGLRKNLPGALRREFGRADLSRRFCPDLFERMGYSAEVQEGPAEAGSDVVVTVGNPCLPDDGFRIGVQVFAYEGTVEEWALQDKLEQLLGGWEDNSLDYGVLLTTGRCSEAAVAALHKHNKEKPDRPARRSPSWVERESARPAVELPRSDAWIGRGSSRRLGEASPRSGRPWFDHSFSLFPSYRAIIRGLMRRTPSVRPSNGLEFRSLGLLRSHQPISLLGTRGLCVLTIRSRSYRNTITRFCLLPLFRLS